MDFSFKIEGLDKIAAATDAVRQAVADEVNRAKNGRDVYFNVNRHINPTNVCALSCKFCAFSRKPGEPGAYAYTDEELATRAKAAAESVPPFSDDSNPEVNPDTLVPMKGALFSAGAVELDFRQRWGDSKDGC